MAITQFSSKKVGINLGVAAQAFYYKRDSKTGEVVFLLANRSEKTFGGHTGPTASGGMKDSVGMDKVRTKLGIKKYEADEATLKREYLEETGVIAQSKPPVTTRMLAFFRAKTAFEKLEQQRFNTIGSVISGVFENFAKRFTLIHSQINNPHNPRWDATHDNFYACELTETEFDKLASSVVNHSTGNHEVSSYQIRTARDLLARADMASVPPKGFMSLELENYAIMKLLHHIDRQHERQIEFQATSDEIPVLTIDAEDIKMGTPVISHGIRRIRKKRDGSFFAEVVEYNPQGKLVVTGDKYRIRDGDVAQYEALIGDAKADLYRKRQDQEPTILLPHAITKKSKFKNGDAWVYVNPGDRIVVRKISTPNGVVDAIEAIPAAIAIKDYTHLEAPAKYQKRGTAPTFSPNRAAPQV